MGVNEAVKVADAIEEGGVHAVIVVLCLVIAGLGWLWYTERKERKELDKELRESLREDNKQLVQAITNNTNTLVDLKDVVKSP